MHAEAVVLERRFTKFSKITRCNGHYSWLHSTVGGTPVFDWRTDHVLHSACSRLVTTMWVNRMLQVSQLGQLSLSSFRGW